MVKDIQKKEINRKWFYVVLIGLMIAGLGGGYVASSFLHGNNKEISITDPSQLRGGETRSTLSPALFTGKIAYTYQIAREIPEVLDSLYCYCDCKHHHGHKSLLTCYVDEHGADCDICQNEAIRAYELVKQGKDILTIRKTIDREFSH